MLVDPTTRLFVGYFPRTTKKAAVKEHLSRFGELTDFALGGGEDGGDLHCFVQFRCECARVWKASWATGGWAGGLSGVLTHRFAAVAGRLRPVATVM